MAGVDGLEALRRMVAGEIPYPPMADTIAMRIVELERGRVVWEAEPGEYLYNPIGTVHAGLRDDAARLGDGHRVRLDRGGGNALDDARAEGELHARDHGRHGGRALHRDDRPPRPHGRHDRGEAEDAEERLLAHATSTILVLDALTRSVHSAS